MSANWELITKKLKKFYKEQDKLNHFKNDEIYLKNAFLNIEELWNKQFQKIEKLKVIMISEAPFYGDIQRYLYNPHTAPSVFFYFKDLEVFLKDDEKLVRPKTTVEQKNMMYDYFYKNGFITLDIFPFALNPNNTAINYRDMSKKLYYQLLEETTKEYLIPKLKACLEKSDSNTHFVYRYKRFFDKTENHFEKVLAEVSPKNQYKIDSINGKGMFLDKKKLKELLK